MATNSTAAGQTPQAGCAKGLQEEEQSNADASDESLLRELCAVNGINFDKLTACGGGASKVTRLEIFFFGCPRLSNLHLFPQLSSLCVVNQPLTSLAGLQPCCHTLSELWICETQLKSMEGVASCTGLRRLYLYSNAIARIQGLSSLSSLEILWLNGNKISRIEGLDNLKSLKSLNLASNLISLVGRSLDHLTRLEELNLSGNQLSSLQELVCLSSSIPSLSSLSLSHPLHPPNPLSLLCNYATFALYHLPTLRYLDDRDVGSHDLHRLVQGLVAKKKQFYRMQTHRVAMEGRRERRALRLRLESQTAPTYARLRALQRCLKGLQHSSESSEEGVKKQESLSQRITLLSEHVSRLEGACVEGCRAVEGRSQERSERLLTELRSGGNVRFSQGDPGQQQQLWYQSCTDLTQSRFSVTDLKVLDATGIKVTGVTRVENRGLFNRFNSKLRVVLECEAYKSALQQGSYKQLLDYLYLVWQPEHSVNSLCEEGLGRGGVVLMSNSVNLADAPRLKAAGFHGDGLHGDRAVKAWLAREGVLVLCKVFMGQTSDCTSTAVPTQKAFPTADCVYRCQGPSLPSNQESHQREWFVFDPELVLPEYLISFQYTSPSNHDNVLDHVMSCDPPVTSPSDEELLQQAPPLSLGPKLAMLDEATALKICSKSSAAEIRDLVLHDNHLTRFRLSNLLQGLVKLVLSFNELESATDLNSMPSLEHLDVSFNKLPSLDGLKGLPRLLFLDVSWNQLCSHSDDITVLRKHTPLLETFDCRGNRWSQVGNSRAFVLGRLKSLQTLDGASVGPDEVAQAVRQAVSSHLAMATLLSHAHTEEVPPHSLTLLPSAHVMQQMGKPRPLQLSNHGNDWCSKVTAVCLQGLGLRKVSCLEQLPQLKWLSLASNALSSLESLAACPRLVELTVDDNLLSSLQVVEHLPSLVWLSAAHNLLPSLPHTPHTLTKLEYLNVSCNRISSLQGVQHLSALCEFYASGNSIASTRELFQLKPATNLAVLDLIDNPVCSEPLYRAFSVFHLPGLRALDACPIDAAEVAAAREKFGGRLTQDVIFERQPGVELASVQRLDLPHSGIKTVDLTPVDSFHCLASLNLEHNALSSLHGLLSLHQLHVLCLNHNHIDSLLPPRCEDTPTSGHVMLRSLEVLHLAYNGISNLAALQLGKIPSLRALFLQGNEISRVEGLEGLENLTELVLDRNRIKSFQEGSFRGLTSLKELHCEENRLRELAHLSPLANLERLYLGANRIQDFSELEKICPLTQLVELSLISNPVSRRLQHRSLLIHCLPSLLSLDGIMVGLEERHTAELSYSMHHDQQEVEVMLPDLANPAHLKVMNVPFALGHTHPPPAAAGSQSNRRRQLEARNVHLQNLQGYHDRRRGGRR